MYYVIKFQILCFMFDMKLQLSTVSKVFETTTETSKSQTLKFTNIAMNFLDPTICKIALSMYILAFERFGLILSER